jgi:hypothetical protein
METYFSLSPFALHPVKIATTLSTLAEEPANK